MLKVERDVCGRIIYHGDGINDTSYLYDENNIVCEEVYTEKSEKTGILYIYTWTYDGKFLYIKGPDKNIKTDRIGWWIKNKTADKIREYYDKYHPRGNRLITESR